MAISDARRRANDKWRAKLAEIRFRVTREKKEAIRAHAAKKGESLNAFLNRAVEEAIDRDENMTQPVLTVQKNINVELEGFKKP